MGDWEDFRAAIEENNEIFDPRIEAALEYQVQYGQLIIKNLILLSGGSLVALPAMSPLLPDVPASVFALAAIKMFSALMLFIVCAYAAHLNFSFFSHLLLFQKHRRAQEIEDARLDQILSNNPPPEKALAAIAGYRRKVGATMWIAHVSGIVGIAILGWGAFSLLLAATGGEWW